MAIFLTGSTGYIGAHVAANLLGQHDASLNLLVRGRDPREAELRLWNAMQLHMPFPAFYEYLQSKIRIFRGDLTNPGFGLDRADYDRLVHTTDSVIHCAASLNRKSEKACLNVNLRGTLEVVQMARQSQYYHGLRRFSDISTVAVAGKRSHEVVTEDRSIEWDRSDYDPYARTKKFCEHMVRELLPDVPLTIFRPSIVLGDSRYPETTQFDMVRSFVFLAGLASAAISLARPDRHCECRFCGGRDFHAPHERQARARHLSSFFGHRVADFPRADQRPRQGAKHAPDDVSARHGRAFYRTVNMLANRQGRVGHGAALMKVFLPYLTWNTVFDNARVTTELGRKPVPFSEYSFPLLRFSRQHNFTYPYKEWPTTAKAGGSAA